MKCAIISFFNKIKFVGLFGIMSYSIYVWHQPILAFYRYFYSTVISIKFVINYVFFVLMLAYITYYFIEKKININVKTRIASILSLLLISGSAFVIYMRAGVVRDVPELGIKIDDAHRNMFAEYNDRIYQFEKDFTQTQDKIKVLCIGNSFARDWSNILLESQYADKIDLSYSPSFNENLVDRIKKCDYIFTFGWKNNIPSWVWEVVNMKTEVWGIGTKNFGVNNGQIYYNRQNKNYYEQTVRINPNFFKINDKLKLQWKDKYVDLIQLSLASDSSIVVFSDDHKFISQDCRHLTQAGAKFFADKINFERIFHQFFSYICSDKETVSSN